MTQVLVTGGGGFVGTHLVAALSARGHRVRILDVRPAKAAPPGTAHIKGSVLDAEAVREALRGADEVYHLAALPGMWLPHRSDFYEVNCRGTETVIGAARAAGVKRFLHCSTESILFGRNCSGRTVDESTATTVDERSASTTGAPLATTSA